MFWIVVIIICAIIATIFDTVVGKIVAGSFVSAIGFLLLSWITGLGFFIVLAKACGIVIVVSVIGSILMTILK